MQEKENYRISVENQTRITSIEDQFNRHQDRIDDQLDKILSELDELKKIYYQERNDFLNRISNLEKSFYDKLNRMYITILCAIIGGVWNITWEFLKAKGIIR